MKIQECEDIKDCYQLVSKNDKFFLGDISKIYEFQEVIEEFLERENQKCMGIYHEKLEEGFWNGDDNLNDIGNLKIKKTAQGRAGLRGADIAIRQYGNVLKNL